MHRDPDEADGRIWIIRASDGAGQRRLFEKRLVVRSSLSARISWQPRP
jgi:hypothetical protein